MPPKHQIQYAYTQVSGNPKDAEVYIEKQKSTSLLKTSAQTKDEKDDTSKVKTVGMEINSIMQTIPILSETTILPMNYPNILKSSITNIMNVSCGYSHTACVMSNGNVYTFGYNNFGQLGDGTNTDTNIPTKVILSSPAIGVSCGYSHTACVMTDGNVYTFGHNKLGKLGDGTTINRNIPTKVNLPSGVSAIGVSCGGYHTACVMSNGDVYTFGDNEYGQLGDGTTTNRNIPTKVNLPSGVFAIGVSCGGAHTACVMSNGDVYTFGWNSFGQLGDGTTTKRNNPTKVNLPSGVSAIGVSCGDFHTACVMSNGDVYTFGYNGYGQLGDGTTTERNIPTKVNLPSGVSAIGVSCGGYHTACVMSNGDVYTFGYNCTGQLGDGTNTDTNNPTKVNLPSGVSAIGVSCGDSHTACVMSNGDVYTFGWNECGLLGDGTTINRNNPTKVILPSSMICVSCGGNHTACVMTNGDVYTFGFNRYGQLGDGTTINRNNPTKVNLPSSAICVSCGVSHTACVMTNGDVYTFGNNNNGQLGDGTNTDSNIPTKVNLPSGVSAIDVSCGSSHTACVMSNGDVYTFGWNGNGQLGDGTNTERNNPTKVKLPSGVSVIGVSCGVYHTACVMSNGDVYTFGSNRNGQLGDGTSTNIPTKVNLPSGVSAIGVSCGDFHTACVMTNGDVYTFGKNNYGQLGDGTNNNSNNPTKVNLPSGVSAIGVSCGGIHTACVMSNGDVYTFGWNGYGRLGDGTNDDSNIPTKVNLTSSVISVSCGGSHTACVMSNGDVYTFGYNYDGRLGIGTSDYNSHPNPTKVNLPSSVIYL